MTTAGGVIRRARSLSPSETAKRYGIWLVLGLLLIAAGIVGPAFFSGFVLRDTAKDAALLGIVTVGQALVMYTGGVDLSVAGLTVLAAAVAADPRAASPGAFFVAVVLVALIGIAVGLINAYLVVKRQVQPFVVTFGMLITLQGVTLIYTKAAMSGSTWPPLARFASGRILGVPVLVLIWLAVLAVAVLVVNASAGGRRFLFAGSNERAAFLSGVHVARAKTLAYCTCSLLAVLSGFLLAGRTGYVDNYTGQGTELDSITAALVGGMTFAGGEGSLVNAAGAALFLSSLYKLLIVLQLSPDLQSVVKGGVLLIALAVMGWRRTQSS